MIRKLLIANRGEIACRIMRTCQQMGIATVAVFSDVDATALHVQMADEAIHIGASSVTESYLNIENILDAARRTNSDAVHPAYGFLAENAGFAQAVVDAGLIWVGPQPDVIATMGDKRQAKAMLDGVPYVPGYAGEVQDNDTLIEAANAIGYPIMIKAAAGGGGKGMRAVDSPSEMVDALNAARREAIQAFGDDMLMLEKRLVQPRHIEVQIIGDSYGNVMALGERECSIQRRHQKIVEESPAYGLGDDLRENLHRTAVEIGRQLDYQNAGTVEFLLDNDGNFYFIEMNTRLQVEHPVTEEVFALDLVRWQLELADGARLYDLLPPFADSEDFAFAPNGHAIEVRIYAEDPSNEFLPVTGDILYWNAPDGARTDAGVQSGDTVSTFYDPMLAKVIAHGYKREAAIRKLDYALSRLALMGIRNNIDFLRRVLVHPEHVAGNLSTQFLDEYPELMYDNDDLPPAILIAGAFAKGSEQGRWRNNPNRPVKHQFIFAGSRHDVALTLTKAGYEVSIGDDIYGVNLKQTTMPEMVLVIDGHQQRFTVVNDEEDYWIQSSDGTYRLQWQTPLPLPNRTIAQKGSLRAPMPGQVISVEVEVGQEVTQGTVLMIIEAMKMEHQIKAPSDGVIEEVMYVVGNTVQQDDVLLALNVADE